MPPFKIKNYLHGLDLIQGVSLFTRGPICLSRVIKAIEKDFWIRFPGYHKSCGEGLAALCGVMLQVRSANLMELALALPREIFEHLLTQGQTIVLMMDQSHSNDVLILSAIGVDAFGGARYPLIE